MTPMKKHIEWLKRRVTISKEQEEALLEEEKQQIINAYCQGALDISTDENIFPRETGEQYYENLGSEDFMYFGIRPLVIKKST
jgi:hypothetical protein